MPARRDRWRGLALALPLLLLLLGVLSLGAATLPGRADFAFCNQSDVSSLDPALSTGQSDGRIQAALFEGLTRPDPQDCAPLPGVAESWQVSSDGLSWTFALRSQARWSDGTPVTAQDFVYSLARVLHPATAARNASLLWCIVGAEAFTRSPPEPGPDTSRLGIVAEGPLRLRIDLLRPTPDLASRLALPSFLPVQRACLERDGEAWVKPGRLVGNGPFVLVERRLRDRLRLQRSPTYWGADEVALETVDALSATGITTQLNLYLTGEVDWMIKPPPGLSRALEGRPDLLAGRQFGTTFLRFNLWGGPFDGQRRPGPLADRRVRAALALALDRTSLAHDVLRGGHEPIDSYVPAGLPPYVPARLPPADPDEARRLLAEAGYPGGSGLPRFSLLAPHNESTRDFCEAVAAQWRAELGVQTELVHQVFGVYLDSSTRGLYDVAWGAWIGDTLDVTSFLECFLSGSGNNRTGFADAAYDALVAAAAEQPDPALRADLLQRAEQRLLDELPIAPLVQRVNLNLVAPRVRGFHDNLLDVHPLRDLAVVEPAR